MKEQPQDFKDDFIVHIYKQKENWQASDNLSGISLLSISGKILARVFLNCLNNHLEHGLLLERNVELLTWCLLQEKYQEQNTDLYSTYIDLTKAFNMISRNDLWRIMAKYGCLEKFITIVRQFHDGMHARVQDNGRKLCSLFISQMGLSRGCVLAPTLFSIMFSAMLFDAFSGLDNGIDIRYLTDCSVFNLRRLQAKTKVKNIVSKFLFADDCALNVATKANRQNSVDKFSMVCDNFDLTSSPKKTDVMHQPAPGKPYIESNITIKGQRLKVVEKFTYLGSTLSLSLSSWMTRWTLDLQKRVQPLADSIKMCGIGKASRRQQKSKYTKLSFLTSSFMAVKRGRLINGIQRS